MVVRAPKARLTHGIVRAGGTLHVTPTAGRQVRGVFEGSGEIDFDVAVKGRADTDRRRRSPAWDNRGNKNPLWGIAVEDGNLDVSRHDD